MMNYYHCPVETDHQLIGTVVILQCLHVTLIFSNRSNLQPGMQLEKRQETSNAKSLEAGLSQNGLSQNGLSQNGYGYIYIYIYIYIIRELFQWWSVLEIDYLAFITHLTFVITQLT